MIRALCICLLVSGVAHAGGPDDARAKAAEDAARQAQAPMHRCVEKVGAEDYRRAEGKLTLTVVIGEEGRAQKVEIAAPKVDQALVDCVTGVWREVRFAAPFAAGDRFLVPLDLRAEPNVTVRAEDVAVKKLAYGMRKQRLVSRESTAASQAFLYRLWPSGGTANLDARTQIYVVLAGAGTVVLGGKPHALAIGDVLVGGKIKLVRGSVKGLELVALETPRHAEGVTQVLRADGVAETVIAGGKGGVRVLVTNASHPGALKPRTGAAATMLRFDAGAAVPEHTHPTSAEILWVTGGAGTLTYEGEALPVTAGMAVHIPAGAKHAFTVTSAEPFTAIQFYAPAGPEERFLAPAATGAKP